MIYNNVLEAMGQTPMIRLSEKMVDPKTSAQVLVKYEGLNVGGSIKTRTALEMIVAAEKEGILDKDSIIVEPTSGNQGIGLSLVGAVRGYKTVIIMPDSVSEERRKICHHYGAEIELVHDDGDIGKCIDDCIKLAYKMKEEDPHVFIPQQFENPANPAKHYATTGPEVWEQTGGKIDIFVAGIGTGGTISGVAKYLKEKNPAIKVYGVEPATSAVLNGKPSGPHKLQGIGAGFVPKTYNSEVVDEVLMIENDDAIRTGRELAQQEGLLVGISSGAAAYGAALLAKRPENKGKNIVVLLPDTGDRYLSTALFAD